MSGFINKKIYKKLWPSFLVAAILFSAVIFHAASAQTSVQTSRQIDISAYVLGKNDEELDNGQYSVRFAIYSRDRETVDPYPSNSDAKIWEEVQAVEINGGILNAYLGAKTSLPDSLDFSSNNYYLGIRIGTDSEMVPRKKIAAIPLAINAFSLQGAVPGTEEGNILMLGNNGTIEESVLPEITTLGTVDAGVWEADQISSEFIDTALAGKTYNGLTLTSNADGFSIAGGLTSRELTLTGGDVILDAPGSAGSIAYSNGTGYVFSSVGTAGQVLVSNGSGAPTWGSAGGSSQWIDGLGGIHYLAGNVGIGTANPTFLAGFSGLLDLRAEYPALKLEADSGQMWQFGIDAADNLSILSQDVQPAVVINTLGDIGVGIASPAAHLHIKAGTGSPESAPLKFTAGTSLITTEAGAMEWDGTNLFITQTSGPTRKTLAYTDPGNQGGVGYYSSADTLSSSDAGIAGQVLLSGGSGAPTWGTVSGGVISSDSLDFTEFADAMTLDNDLAIDTGVYDFTINGTLQASSLIISGEATLGTLGLSLTSNTSIIPSAPGLNLGSSGSHWANLYVDNLSVGTGADLNGTTSEYFAINTDSVADEDMGLRFYRSALNGYAALVWDAGALQFNLFERENTAALGDLNVDTLYANGSVGIGTSSPGSALEVVGDIISKGTNWTARSAAEANGWQAVAYGNGLFVALANDGTNRVMTSPDGVNWTARSAAEANGWMSVVYGNGLFVAVSWDGTNRVMTSPDGINWTARSAAEANQWYSIAYGDGLFVAVSSGGTNRVMTSPDGINWTARSAAEANQWYSIAYGNGLFVAVSSDGANRIMISSDGINWTAQAAPEIQTWFAVAYGNGLFVAVGNGVMTSPDGINWTARTAAENNQWRSIAYGNGLFVAVSETGTNRVMTSPDGIDWTARSAAELNVWLAVAYGNGTFVAVSYDGVDRVMTSGKTEQNILAHNNIYQGGMNIFGNVGIGTLTPGSTLDVNGIIRATSGANYLEMYHNGTDAVLSSSSGEILIGAGGDFVLDSGVNLGVGTASPSSIVDIEKQGTVKANSDLLELTNSGNAADMDATLSSILFNQWYYDASAPAVADAGRITLGTETDWTSIASTQDSYLSFSTALDGAVSEKMWITSGGNVGIGTNNPGAKLEIDGGAGSGYGLEISDLGTATRGINMSNSGLGSNDAYIYLDSSNVWLAGDEGIDASIIQAAYGSESLPSFAFSFDTNTGIFNPAADTMAIATNGTEKLRVDSAGNVGIGITPTARLHLGGTAGQVSFEINSNETTAGSNVLALRSDVAGADDLIFRIQADGAVFADGAYTGTGADYAEYFETTDTDLQSGEAVCIDPLKENAVKRCVRSADNNVMGIVSSDPSIVGNSAEGREKDPKYKIVAMLGQIKGKVSNENGTISIGDSLTSASIPGYLRKANPEESTVGVALQNSAETQGAIQILISRRNKSLTVEKVEEAVSERIAAMNVEDQVNSLITQARAELDQASEARFAGIDGQILAQQNLIATLQVQMEELKNKLNAETNLAQIDLNTQDAAFIKLLLGTDRVADPEDVDILGRLSAKTLATGAIEITLLDPEAPTIGEGAIPADESLALIKTKAVTAESKIYITPIGSTHNQVIYVGAVDEAKSFEVKVDRLKSKDADGIETVLFPEEIRFNWCIVSTE